MMDREENPGSATEDATEALLKQLLHLKGYERPDPARMARSKQNIMRQVREISGKSRWSLSDLLEMNIPWFFAEPRYGIAALFIVFAMLQFWGVNAHKQERGKTGIYTRNSGVVMAGHGGAVYTNSINYPELPDNLTLFPEKQGDSSIKTVGFGPKKTKK